MKFTLRNQAASGETNLTDIRSVLKFNRTLGVSIPRKYCEKLGLFWRGHVRVFLVDGKTIGIKKLEAKE